MKLQVNFDALIASVNSMGAKDRDFILDVALPDLEEIDTQLREGIAVSIDDIEILDNGLLSYKGRQVLLYIQDHNWNVVNALNNGASGNKFHVASCRTLDNMNSRGRYNRYVAKNDIDGIFFIDGKNNDTQEYASGETDLKVCKNCLKHLNYKGYEDSSNFIKKELFDRFSLETFFDEYQQFFKYKPKYGAGKVKSKYTDNWSEVSIRYRDSVSWVCENCNIDLTQYAELLHTHHINGVKQDNSSSNLKALCCECHAKEPNHGHMGISEKQKSLLRKIKMNSFARSERV